MSLLMTDALAVSPTQRQRVSRASHRTRRQAGLTLDDLGADLISYAMSQWPAATVANAAASCRTLYGLLDLAVQLACAQMGRALPPRRNQYDSLTCRLHFVQHSVLRAAKTLSASTSKSVCLVNDSAVLSWGSAGVYEEITTLLPTRVPFSVATPVREVAAGESHCLLLSHGGSVFSWGENNAHGQLGQGDTLPQREPRRVRALDGLHVMQVACGKEHSLVLTTGGDAYSFGNGTLGRLGLGVAVDAWTPQRICAAGKRGTPSFARENAHVSEVVAARLADVEPLPRLVMVAAGLFHSLGTAADGSVYSWGSGTNGRLGHGDTVMQLRPHRIATLRDVVYVAAGSGHSLAIDSKGRLYTWGQGYNGRLGHGNQETKPQPSLVEGLVGKHIVAAAAGSEFTVALTREGDAFSFGTDDCTGHVWWGRGWSVSPDRRAALTPTKIKALHGLVVEELAAGSLHTIARTKSGEIFTFGSGANGQLGHGDLQEQLLPKRVEAAELATESSAA